MTRLELLERVNTLNMNAEPGERYWTVTVMYNTVIWKQTGGEKNIVTFHETIPGIPS